MTDSYRDAERLEFILEMISRIEASLENLSLASFVENTNEIDLTAFRLSQVGESAGRLGEEFRTRHVSIDWRELRLFRNMVAHEYRRVLPQRIWEAARELGDIKAMCVAELKRLDAE